jgi:hypothetical protein
MVQLRIEEKPISTATQMPILPATNTDRAGMAIFANPARPMM